MFSNELREAALDYALRGWSVIPLCWPGHPNNLHAYRECLDEKKGKVVLVWWKPWQQHRPSLDLIENWWTTWPFANVGVVLGAVSGMIGWDVDGKESFHKLNEICGGNRPETWSFRSGGGGVRFLYRWPVGAPPMPAHWHGGSDSLTFLGEGSYTVMPPSRHWTGGSYQWLMGRGPVSCKLADATLEMVQALTAKQTLKQRTSGGERREVPPLITPTHVRLLARAAGYAKGFEPAIQGQGGRVVCFKLACRLIHGLGLHPQEAHSIMWEVWNHKCNPPWTEGELWERVMSAYQTGHSAPIEEKARG